MKKFSLKVWDWLVDTLGTDIACDPAERNYRFLEEALELVQSLEMPVDKAHEMVDYVYGRDVGYAPQEVGGVIVCLAALCEARGINLEVCADKELTRIQNEKVKVKIREKQAKKKLRTNFSLDTADAVE